MPLAWVRPFFLYGPREHPERLVASVARALLRGELAATSHGRQLRDYLHVQDVADAVVATLDSDLEGALNIGSGEAVALRDIVTRLGETVGRPELLRIGEVAARSNDVPLVVADNGRLLQELGWRPALDLASGLAQTINWWRATLGDEALRHEPGGGGHRCRHAGYGAAHRLEEEGIRAVVYERRATYGGHTATYRSEAGFTFDEGPHISFTSDRRMQDLLADAIDGEYETVQARVNNYWRGHWIKHPVQVNLHGLPADLVVRVLSDFIAATHRDPGPIRTYEDWLRASFGDALAETFPMEYTRKNHTTDAINLTTDWIGPRLYRPSLEEVLRGALTADTSDAHYITEFRYPRKGGFVSYLRRFMERADVRFQHHVVSVDPASRELRFADGRVSGYDKLISSVPLPELIAMIDGAPPDVLDAATRLASSEVVVVNLGIGRPDVLDAHWTYFYDPDVLFARLSTPYLQSALNVPDGASSLQAECYFSDKYKPRVMSLDEITERVIGDLTRCGVLREDDRILVRQAVHVRHANVIFDHDRAPAVAICHGFLDELGIAYAGRYGEWAYLWTDESFVSGERAAELTLTRA